MMLGENDVGCMKDERFDLWTCSLSERFPWPRMSFMLYPWMSSNNKSALRAQVVNLPFERRCLQYQGNGWGLMLQSPTCSHRNEGERLQYSMMIKKRMSEFHIIIWGTQTLQYVATRAGLCLLYLFRSSIDSFLVGQKWVYHFRRRQEQTV